MTTVRINLPKMSQCHFSISADYDDNPIRGNAMASGDDAADKKLEDYLINEVNNGNVWAWASVKVECHYKGLTGTDYLGCCSYKDEDDFKKDGYYKDMKNAAYADLIQQIKDLKA